METMRAETERKITGLETAILKLEARHRADLTEQGRLATKVREREEKIAEQGRLLANLPGVLVTVREGRKQIKAVAESLMHVIDALTAK